MKIFLLCLLGLAVLLVEETSAQQFIVPPFQDWSLVGSSRRITDMAGAIPAGALSAQRETGRWKIITYATAGFQGRAVVTGPETNAPEITLPLGVSGWHAVYVGLGTVAQAGKADDNGVWIRLSGDATWMRRRNTCQLSKPQRDVIEDVFVSVADLTNRSIQFRQMPFRPGAVMYVRLVPLSPDEVSRYTRQLSDKADRHTIATIDGHAMIWQNRARTAEDLLINFDGFADSDFGKWWFQYGGGDLTNYPTQVGTVIGSQSEDFVRESDREYAESLRALFKAGVSPLVVSREAARRAGAEFHVFLRPSSWQAGIPWEENFSSRFFAEHPEWRCVDREGIPTLYMSYAEPEVRRHVIDLLKETLQCEPDGVGVLFHRGIPLILWEEPFVRAYQAKYGVDPRTVPEDHPTIADMRAEILTSFLRELRAMLDQTAREQGRAKPYRVSITAFSLEKDNRKYGLDVERWVREKLVDGDIAPTSFAEGIPTAKPDLAYYLRITRGSGVGVYPMFNAWRAGEPPTFLKKILAAYDAGATGIALWDPDTLNAWGNKTLGQGVGQAFDVYRVIGHPDILREWLASGLPKPLLYPLIRFGDNRYSRWAADTDW